MMSFDRVATIQDVFGCLESRTKVSSSNGSIVTRWFAILPATWNGPLVKVDRVQHEHPPFYMGATPSQAAAREAHSVRQS
jgi:hypothetical protein